MYGQRFVFMSTRLTLISTVVIWLVSSAVTGSLLSTEHRLPIVVETGRSAYLTMAHLPIDPKLKVADICQVEVDDMQPLSSVAGFLKPKKFPCFFEPKSVIYQHEGSPLSSFDTIMVNIYFFRKHHFAGQNVTIQISIISPKNPLRVNLKSHLSVDSSKGISEALSTKILSIKYDFKKEFCRLKHYNQAAASNTVYPWLATRYWPLTGLLITFNKSKVYEFKMECQQALLMGYRFMHRRTRGPSVDFLPLIVEISDVEKQAVIDITYLQIPILIATLTSTDLFKNLLPPPVIETFRTVRLKNSGGTISLLPKDVLEVRSQDKNRGPLIAKIVSIKGNDLSRFVNMRDPSKEIWSFLITDLVDGLIGFQLVSYSETIEKIFRVDLVIYDSYLVHSDPLILKIVDELDIKNQPFQVFTKPFYTYTANVRQLQYDNIQILSQIDNNLIRYRLLSVNTTYGRFTKHPSTPLFVERQETNNYFNIEDIKNNGILYNHNGGLENVDVIRIEAFIDRFRFIRFLLPVYIVRIYDRCKDTLIHPMTEFLTPTEGIMPLRFPKLVNGMYLFHTQRDNMDLRFSVVREPKFGTLLKLYTWENVSHTAILKTEFSVSDLLNGLIYFQSNPSSSNNRDSVELHQIGRVGYDTSMVFFNIKLYVTNFLIPKMDPNVVFKVHETTQYAKLSYLNLNFVNNNLQPDEIVYIVTRGPIYDTSQLSDDAGRLISLKSIQNHLLVGDTVLTTKLTNYRSAQITSVISFTQQQILDSDIVYIPPADDVGPRDRQVGLLYSVRDSYGCEIRNVPFSILIKAVNDQAPFVKQCKVTVARDEEVYLTTSNCDVDDMDTDIEKLSIKVVQLPSYGRLTNEKNLIIANGSLIPATYLLAKYIRYKHDGRNVKEDRFKIRVFDGIQFSNTYSVVINITKRIISNSSWHLYINNSIIVKENLTVTLHETAFQTVMKDFDFNQFSNPTFILVAMPTRGNLIKDENVISMFYYEEIKNAKIKYQHTSTEIGSNSQFDFAQIWILDSGLSFNVNFTIVPVNSQPPVIFSQAPLQVNECGLAVISYYTLGVSDADSTDRDLTIKVIRPPLWGKICSAADKSITQSFSVADIRQGKVLYFNNRCANGVEQTSDVFTVQAFDAEFSSSSLEIPVVIHPTNDEIPKLVLKDFNIAIGENRTLNEQFFLVSDADIPRDLLQIYVTEFPSYGNLSTLYKHGELKRLTKDSTPLTLQLLKFVSIIYTQNRDKIPSVGTIFPLKDRFELTATDGKHRVFQKCVVNITGFNIHPPVLFTSLVQMNKIDERNISNIELRAKDDDTLPQDVVFVLLNPPKIGDLLLKNEPLKRNEVFTQENINNQEVKYKYTGQPVSYAKDTFIIKAHDGSFESNSKTIHIFLTQPIQKPKMKISVNPIKVEIGRRFIIDRSAFKIENPVSEFMDSLTVTLTRRSTCGALYHYKNLDTPITKFLFSDFENRKILLFISECPDVVKVMNIALLITYRQQFEQIVNVHVQISPRSNSPPVLEKNSVVETLRGSNVLLTKEKLMLNDQDSASDKISLKYLKANDSLITIFLNGIESDTFTQYDINSQHVVINIPDSVNISNAVLPFLVTDGENDGYVINSNQPLNSILNLAIDIKDWIHRDLILLNFLAPNEMKFVDGYNAFQWTFTNILVSRPDAKIASAVDLVAGFFFNMGTKQSVKFFTQVDINKGWIFYFLHKEKSSMIYKEIFQFKIFYEEFRISTASLTITWSILEFDKIKYKLCPQRGLLTVDVVRKGDLSVESHALVGFISKEAIIDQDFRLLSQRLLVFVPGQRNNTISIKILLSGSVKTPSRFHVTLKSPKQAVVGQKSTTVISIKDREVCSGLYYFLPEKSLKTVNESIKVQGVKGMIHDFHSEVEAPQDKYYLPSSDQLEMQYSYYLSKKKSVSKCMTGWRTFSRRCYRSFLNKLSWKNANIHCAKFNSYLTSVTSNKLLNWLMKTFDRPQSFWIGLYRSATSEEWKYTNNEAVIYSNWDKGFPKKSNQKLRDCVIVTKRKQWRNRPCVKKRSNFICMKNPQVSM